MINQTILNNKWAKKLKNKNNIKKCKKAVQKVCAESVSKDAAAAKQNIIDSSMSQVNEISDEVRAEMDAYRV